LPLRLRQETTAAAGWGPFFLKEKREWCTFGISSGTLDCNQPSRWVSNEKLNKFVADNMDNLAKDAAMGQGEYVDTLAELMDVPGSKRVEFSQMLQDNFSNIFTEASVSHLDVIENIAHLM